MLDAIKRAKSKNVNRTEVYIGNSNFTQLALYQKCEFRIVVVEKNFFTKNYSGETIENGIKCIDMTHLTITF